jgi:uncharacterized RDD family membrane protein YckC
MRRMTQPADNPGGWPAADRPADDQDAGPPVSAPPPDSWHFPPGPAGPDQAQPPPGSTPSDQPPAGSAPPGQPSVSNTAPGQPAAGSTASGRPAAEGAPPAGVTQPHGSQPPPAPPPHGMPPPHGTPLPGYGPPPQNGPLPGYGPPPQSGPPPGYGAPYGQPQYSPPPYGTSPHYGTPPPYAAPQPYGTPYPAYPAGLPVGPEPDLAEWWRRLLGRLIDILVLATLATPIALAVLSHPFSQYQRIVNRYPDLNTPAAQSALSKADGRLLGSWLVFACIIAVLSFFYDSIQHGLWGQTLGKRALGTRVVSAYDRSKISGGTAAGRAATYALIPVVPLVGTLFSLLNGLWLTWDRRRQALHDKVARTIVVKTAGPAPQPAPAGSPW